MSFYDGKTASEELRDIVARMATCKSGNVLCTVRLSTVREAAIMLDKTYSGDANGRQDQDAPQG